MAKVPNPPSGQSEPGLRPRTVQDYIDERPVWPDGTHVPSVPMTKMQMRIWMLAAAGKFFEGFVVFMTGVALPLIARQFEIGPAQNGLVTAASLCGILIGAVGLGSLSDHFGRKSMFVVEMIIFTAFLGAAVFCTSFPSLVFCLFGLGLALGCDYPTAHMIISESIPSPSRGRPAPARPPGRSPAPAAADWSWAHSLSRPLVRWAAPPSDISCWWLCPTSTRG